MEKKMLMIEFKSINDDEIINQIKTTIPQCEVIDVNSFGIEMIIQVVIPIAAIIAPFASPIISKLLDRDICTVKYKDFEYTGKIKNVEELIDKLKEIYPDDVD